MVAAYVTWRFGLQVVGLVWSCGLCAWFAGRRAPLCPSSGAQDLYTWLLPTVLGALVYRSLVWRGAVGYASRLRDLGGSVYTCVRTVLQLVTIFNACTFILRFVKIV